MNETTPIFVFIYYIEILKSHFLFVFHNRWKYQKHKIWNPRDEIHAIIHLHISYKKF